MKRIVSTMLLAAATSAFALSASRVGPVSTYGALKANGGQLSGTCSTYANSAVQVKGMSLFWSSAADSSTNFYTEKALNRMVSEMGIEVVRFAMGVKSDFDKGRGYITGGEDLQKAYLKNMVSAAVDNDIYIIIDWHIESADGYTSDAVKFFEYAAQQYGKYNNVIFEVWNEPVGADMGTVATHANSVITAIRKYSDNLILIGSPEWSSHPEQCAEANISDPKKNYACTLHFYAATHPNGNGGYSERAESAMSKGIPVFASEWGTVAASGKGDADKNASDLWNSWMNTKKVSWANWSASAMNEGSAAFQNLAFDNGLTYTTSGSIVKGYLAGTHSYKDCGLQNGGGSSGNGGFSTGVANGTNTDMVDDLEDGDRYAYTGGWWSAFADSDDDDDGLGKTSISNGKWISDDGKEVYDVLMKSKGDKNTSKYIAGIEGIKLSQGAYKYAPYVTIGLSLLKDPDSYTDANGKTVKATKPVDLSKCNAISYKFKGAAHNFRVETAGVNNWNFHHVAKDGSEEWKEVELSWDQFSQEDWGDKDKHYNLKTGMDKVRAFAWEVKGALDVPDAANQPKYDYLYVDDVRCDGVTIKAISGDGASVAGSSATVPGSSAAVVPGSSASVDPASSAAVSSSSASVPVASDVVVSIDDVEDGDHIATTGGTWYAYNESEKGGKSSITNTYDAELPGYVVNFLGATDATNGTQGYVGLNGIVWNQAEYEHAPFVALGLNTMADTSKGLDLSKCAAISYRYKGAGHMFKIQDGTVEDFAYHEYKNIDAAEWTTVVIPWAKLEQPSWTLDPKNLNHANIKKMAWEVIGYKGFDLQPELNYLYVDDVACVGQATESIKVASRSAKGIKMAVAGKVLNVAVAQSGNVKVQIFDMMGHVVETMSQKMTAGTHSVSLEGLSAGNYVVRVMNNSAVSSARVSIK